jgi:hypothetical protein
MANGGETVKHKKEEKLENTALFSKTLVFLAFQRMPGREIVVVPGRRDHYHVLTCIGDAPMRPIHDLVWISKIDGLLVPAGVPNGEIVTDISELGEGSYELHWFGSASEANAFRIGILTVGVNSIDATLGTDGVQQAVLVHRRDRDAGTAQTLEEAFPLIEHASARNRRLNVIWAKEIEMLRGASRNPDSSFTAAQISRDATENSLPFVFKYDRWEKHPNFQEIKNTGAKSFEIVRRGDQRLLLWKLRELDSVTSMGRSRSRKYRAQIDEIARQYQGSLIGDEIAFPINGDLYELLTRIIPTYSAIYHVDATAKRAEFRRKIYESPQAQQVITLLANGGSIEDGAKISVNPENGKSSKITQKLLSELITAEIVVPMEGKRSTYRLADGVGPLEVDPYEIAAEQTMALK